MNRKELIITILKLLGLIVCTTVVSAGCGFLLTLLFSKSELLGYISFPVVVVSLSFVIYKIAE